MKNREFRKLAKSWGKAGRNTLLAMHKQGNFKFRGINKIKVI